ncbi:ABC transporter permease [Bacillus sp. T33-2]|uniref:ABC transporter permease n=1 Tax=Bacillus sp. T33-2 TaxID=2054168 RepID=UPI000C783AA3|nr:ABC transporter permease [Bacillus sp. T33-2]PLR98509.1 ABC transporter permease [Bacillus sp. T33-2]
MDTKPTLTEYQSNNNVYKFKSVLRTNELKQTIQNLLVLLLFLGLWQIVSLLIKSMYFPTPVGVLQAGINLFSFGDLEGYTMWDHIMASTIRVLLGFAVAAITGVLIGLVMGLYPSLYQGSRLIIEPVRFIPPIAWVPMAIVLLSGTSRYIFLIWLGAFFPIFINILVSVPKVENLLKDVVKIYGGTKSQIIKKVIIPSVLPDIISGMRVGLGLAWMCIVAAEMIGGESVGLGRLILKYAELLRSNEIVVGMIAIGLIGFISNELLLRLEKRLFKWRNVE